jgi:hypothetical protein
MQSLQWLAGCIFSDRILYNEHASNHEQETIPWDCPRRALVAEFSDDRVSKERMHVAKMTFHLGDAETLISSGFP